MKCPTPITIRNPSYGKMKDRIGTMYMQVSCGKCLICMENKRKEWTTKLMLEHKYSITSHFITLTYDEEHYVDEIPKIRDLQLFLKRLRKKIEPFKIRYYCVSEHGEQFGRLHYHALIFNLPAEFQIDIHNLIQEAWGLGYVQVGDVNPATINYCTKYLFKSKLQENEKFISRPESNDCLQRREIQIMSRKPAIGSGYLTDCVLSSLRHQVKTSIHVNGMCRGLPRSVRNVVYNTDARKRLYATACASIANQIEQVPLGSDGDKAIGHLNYLRRITEKKYKR